MELKDNIKKSINQNSASVGKTTDASVTLRLNSKPIVRNTSLVGKISIDNKDQFGLKISHDFRELIGEFTPSEIKKSLTTIYGRSGVVAISSRAIETLIVPTNQAPFTLQYDLTVVQNEKDIEYFGSIPINMNNTKSLISISSVENTSTQEYSVVEAVTKVDDDVNKISVALETLSYIYDKDQNKTVSLHNMIEKMSNDINSLQQIVIDVKEEIKKMQDLR